MPNLEAKPSIKVPNLELSIENTLLCLWFLQIKNYACRLHPRTNEATIIFEGGRLFQQILVNWYALVQQDRLDFIE